MIQNKEWLWNQFRAGGRGKFNKNCPLKYQLCGGDCKYFRSGEVRGNLQYVTCIFKPCHEFTQPEGKPLEECFEGTASAGDCERLLKGQGWDECPYGRAG